MKKVIAPKVNFTKEEEKFIKNVTDPKINNKEVNKILKENGIEINMEEDNKTFPENTIAHDCELKEFEQLVEINPNTGEQTPISEKDIKKDENAINTNIDENIEQVDISSVKLGDEFQDKFMDMYGMNLDSAKSFLNLVKDVRDGKVTSNLFNKLPIDIQKIIRGMCCQQGIVPKMNILNGLAKEFINDAIYDSGIEQAYVDLENGVNEAFEEFKLELKKEGKTIIEKEDYEYDEKVKKVLEFVKEKNPEKKEFINFHTRSIEIYNDATTFTSLKNDLLNNEPCARRLDKHVKRYDKYFSDFMYKYTNKNKQTKYGCRDIKVAINTLARHLDQHEYSNETILKFFVLLCRHTLNYDATKYHDALYMYFSIKSVIRLETLEVMDEKYISILNSLKEILDLIKGGK